MLASFCLQLVALELALRGPAFYLAHPRAIGHLVASAALLYLARGFAARSARRRAAVALAIGAVIAAQAVFFVYYHGPLDDQVAVAARLAWADVRPMLLRVLPAIVGLGLALAALEDRWLRRLRPRAPRRGVAALALALGLVVGGPLRDGTTELRLARAAAAFALASPARARADHAALPPIPSRRARLPNLLFILTESVRAADYCEGRGPSCVFAPEVAALLPDRIPLTQMRSVSSYTAISLSVLLTGLPQTGSRAPIAAAPDLFDLGRATHAGGRAVSVHYWSSQSPNFFERADVARAVDSFITADTLLGHPASDIEEAVAGGLDRALADECRRRMPSLSPPYLVMLHFSGTHAPYFFDEERAPFRPFGHVVNWSGMADLHRSYQDAIVEQDRSIAACVRAFLDAQRGAPSIVFFTSDHGEAFGEHSAIHHGQNLYDEQIHVPAFIAPSPGALAEEELRALEAASPAYVTHFDMLPTLLDALGVLDHEALARARARMPGRSLLRPGAAETGPLPMTNCSEMWTCPINTWGVLGGDRKLIEQAWDGGWRCLSLRRGEREEDLGQCGDLRSASQGFFTKRPDGAPNR